MIDKTHYTPEVKYVNLILARTLPLSLLYRRIHSDFHLNRATPTFKMQLLYGNNVQFFLQENEVL